MGGLKTLYNLLLKDAVKGSGQASGIMSIGDSVRKLAKKKFEAYVATAQKQGVDLDKLSEQELKYIIELNKPQKPKIISADSPEGKGITEALLGKRGQVIEGNFGKPFAKEIDLRQELAKAEARTKRISGNLRADNMQRTEIGKPKLDEDEYDYYREILDDEENNVVMGDETREMLEAMVKEQEAEMAYMKRLYDKGALDPKPGEKGRKKFLDRKAQKGDKMTPEEIEELKKLSEDPEDMATGGRAGFSEGNGVADEDAENAKFVKRVKELMDEGFDMGEAVREAMKEGYANGGRIGYKVGSIDKARRAFLKAAAGVTGGIAALKTGLLGFGKGAAGKRAVEQVVTTPSVPGKPEWFDKLVNKVILEGDDVTKQLATKEREIVHTKKLEEGKFADEVTVYRNLDDGTVRVEYNSVDNMSEAPVNLTFKPGMADETTKGKPADTFQADEIVPESKMVGPDDFEIEDAVDEFDNVIDLNSDVSKLKQFAGEKLTTKEIVEGINKRKRSRAIVEDRGEAADFMTSRQGEYDYSPDDGMASGGIARMLGE